MYVSVPSDRQKTKGLRAAQAHILTAYAEGHADRPDVAIELPTGVGKTLIALLLADFALDRGWSVAYLAGSNALAEQVATAAAQAPGLVAHPFSGAATIQGLR